jgi:adenylate cyclase class 2
MKALIKEIEVKARVTNFPPLQRKLLTLGCILSKPILQKDQIFFKKGSTMSRFQPGLIGIRIRNQDGKILFTVKKRTDTAMSAIEKELEISNAFMMKEVLELLDYEEALTINKSRIKTNYKDYTICLDTVEGLGSFIEVEKMSKGNSKTVQDELHAFLEELGITSDQFITLPYDELLLRKR